MYKAGLLVVPSVVHRLPRTLPPLLTTANDWVTETLYILFHPTLLSDTADLGLTYSKDIQHSMIRAYERGSTLCSGLDVRVLLCNVGDKKYQSVRHLSKKPDILITNKEYLSGWPITEQVQEYFGGEMSVLGVTTGEEADLRELGHVPEEAEQERYQSVCLGGTFDQLHNGHKVLLSQACMVSHGKVTVGVTSHVMHANKVLPELMQTTQERITAIKEFLNDIKPDIECEVLPITDPYGPTIHREEMDCLVVSQETLRGGEAVNEKRAEKRFPPMSLVVIDMMQDYQARGHEEAKLSSTSSRKRMLAKLLRKRKFNKELSPFPHMIGLTGGIASGKSSICQRLEKLGATIIDCDKLGHTAYEPGTDTHRQIVDQFGVDILSDTGHVDRRKLANIVFSHKDKLKQLNEIVWPKIRQMALQEVDKLRKRGVSVVVLDAAVLLEAGWEDMVHEVWVTILPVKEATRRLMERNGLSEEEAGGRVASQMTNDERLAQANVVLSTLWEPDVTQLQVEEAWSSLQERI